MIVLPEFRHMTDFKILHLPKHVYLLLNFLFEALVLVSVVENHDSADCTSAKEW